MNELSAFVRREWKARKPEYTYWGIAVVCITFARVAAAIIPFTTVGAIVFFALMGTAFVYLGKALIAAWRRP